MSGNQRISLGAVTTSSTKGKGMESTLAKVLNSPTPTGAQAPKKAKKQKGKK